MTSVIQIRAENVKAGDIERHVSGQGRLMPWRRVAEVRPSAAPLFVMLVYAGGDTRGGSVRALDLVEVQRDP